MCCHPQVFIRELISNGSDALEKLRHRLMTEGKALPELEIHLQTDSGKGTITIQVLSFGNSRGLLPAALITGLCPVKESLEAEQQHSPQGCSVLSWALVHEAVTSGFDEKPAILSAPHL